MYQGRSACRATESARQWAWHEIPTAADGGSPGRFGIGGDLAGPNAPEGVACRGCRVVHSSPWPSVRGVMMIRIDWTTRATTWSFLALGCQEQGVARRWHELWASGAALGRSGVLAATRWFASASCAWRVRAGKHAGRCRPPTRVSASRRYRDAVVRQTRAASERWKTIVKRRSSKCAARLIISSLALLGSGCGESTSASSSPTSSPPALKAAFEAVFPCARVRSFTAVSTTPSYGLVYADFTGCSTSGAPIPGSPLVHTFFRDGPSGWKEVDLPAPDNEMKCPPSTVPLSVGDKLLGPLPSYCGTALSLGQQP